MILHRWNLKKTPLWLLTLILLVFIVFSIRYNDNILRFFNRGPKITYVVPNRPPSAERGVLDIFSTCNSMKEYTGRRIQPVDGESGGDSGRKNSGSEECDLTFGKWVFDNVTYPLYEESQCPYMSDQLACHKHGDLISSTSRGGGNLTVAISREMWEKVRGKRLMFVGDSLNQGQWISMICLLQSATAKDKRSITPNAAFTIFRAEEYNATVEFLWAPLLVESNNDHPVNHRLEEKIIRSYSIRTHALKWEQADILVFDTYLWWRLGPVKLSSQEWHPGSRGNCYSENEPIKSECYWGSGSDLPTMRMVERIVGKLGPRVSVINVTQLSEYRKDGHPSIYRKFWEALSPA